MRRRAAAAQVVLAVLERAEPVLEQAVLPEQAVLREPPAVRVQQVARPVLEQRE